MYLVVGTCKVNLYCAYLDQCRKQASLNLRARGQTNGHTGGQEDGHSRSDGHRQIDGHSQIDRQMDTDRRTYRVGLTHSYRQKNGIYLDGRTDGHS